jgi:hypothetical protein
MKEKHFPYFTLIDSFKTIECPICYLIKNSIEKYFDNLLYENITNVEFNKRFRESNGFCNFHSYKFLNYNDSIAIASTHKLLLKDKIKELKNTQLNKKRKKNKCIICEYINEAEKRYLSIMKYYLEDKEFKNFFLKSDGLCIPHYKNFIKINKNPPNWFIEFHIKKYEEDLFILNQYLDNCNYPNNKKSKLSSNNKEIWKNVVKILFGFEGKME